LFALTANREVAPLCAPISTHSMIQGWTEIGRSLDANRRADRFKIILRMHRHDAFRDFVLLRRLKKRPQARRNVYRWTDARDGMPYTSLGIQISSGDRAAWIMQRMTSENPVAPGGAGDDGGLPGPTRRRRLADRRSSETLSSHRRLEIYRDPVASSRRRARRTIFNQTTRRNSKPISSRGTQL